MVKKYHYNGFKICKDIEYLISKKCTHELSSYSFNKTGHEIITVNINLFI